MRLRKRIGFAAACSCALGTIATGQIINEDFKLLPDDGAETDEFGRSIAIDSGIVAVGAPFDDDNGESSGAVYLFEATTGAFITKLLPTDGDEWDYFGWTVAIDSGIVAVGAILDDDNGGSGSAYLFNASTGVQIAKLLPTDGASNDQFGVSIAIDNGIVAVGAIYDDDDVNGADSGSVYLFNASTGAQIAKLQPSDSDARDYFGVSVAIDNGIVAVGALGNRDFGSGSGSAYLFNASTGSQIAKLLPIDGAQADFFGATIAIQGGVVVVTTANHEHNGDTTRTGAAYLFDTSTGTQIAELFPSDEAGLRTFGTACSIDNGVIAVGAMFASDIASGAAFLFDASTGVQLAKLLANDGAELDYFGFSVAIDGGIVAVGAPKDDDNGTDSGSAYVFSVPEVVCQPDLNADGFIDSADIAAFIALFLAQSPAADLNADGFIDSGDISAFVALFLAGC